MGKDSGKKSSPKSRRKEKANSDSDRRLAKVQDALDAALRREAKAAARFEAAHAEVIALRSAVAQLTAPPAAAAAPVVVPAAAPVVAPEAAPAPLADPAAPAARRARPARPARPVAGATKPAAPATKPAKPVPGTTTTGASGRPRRGRRQDGPGEAGP
jgi:hypothetical protein